MCWMLASLQPINILKERLLLTGPGRMHHERLQQQGQAPWAQDLNFLLA